VYGPRHAKFLTGRDLSWRMGRMMGREHHHEIIANLRRGAWQLTLVSARYSVADGPAVCSSGEARSALLSFVASYLRAGGDLNQDCHLILSRVIKVRATSGHAVWMWCRFQADTRCGSLASWFIYISDHCVRRVRTRVGPQPAAIDAVVARVCTLRAALVRLVVETAA